MIKRDSYINQIKPFIDTDLVKVLTGFRRSGKSVMLELIKAEITESGVAEDQIISFNFESFSNSDFCDSVSLYNEIVRRKPDEGKKFYIFLDEIQEIENWEKCINSLRVDFDCDIFITGSNAKLLSGELATYLGGRYVEFEIYPFSFEEYLNNKQSFANNSAQNINKPAHDTKDSSSLQELFKMYLTQGGMPFLSNLNGDKSTAIQYLNDIFESVVLKDVVIRNNIRDADLLKRIIIYVLANIGYTFSARSISKYFKSQNRSVAPETILNYIDACCNAFLFYKAQREDLKGKKLLNINEKYYVVDHGLRQAIYGNNERDIEQVLENIVYMELLRRGYTVHVGKVYNKEIDFVAEKQDKKFYIQVAYLLATEETQKRELSSFSSIEDNFPKYMVSMDNFDLSQQGIQHYNICDFLLSEEF